MKKRLAWIDIAKGFCILAVILGHFHKPEWDFLYSFHLTVFFILSGYTLKKSDLSKEYFKQKFQRLMTPYFLTCFAVTVMDVFNSVIISRDSSILTITGLLHKNVLRMFFASGGERYLGSIDLGKGIGAIWFLPAMFFALLIMQIILNTCRSKRTAAVASVLVAAVAAASSKALWLPFSIQAGAFAVPFIFIGMLLKEYDVIESRLKWWHCVILVGVFALGCKLDYAQTFFMVSCTVKDWLLTPLFAICSSIAVIGGAKFVKRCPPLEFVGKNSLLFLCVHLFELNTMSRYYQALISFLNLPDSYYITFLIKLIFISAVVGIILLCKRLMSRPPIKSVEVSQRNVSIDIMRAMLIILMIIGEVTINGNFRNIIYSFHMMAFVMVSGYFYKSGIPFFKNLIKTVKSLAPYAVFAVIYVVITHRGWLNELLTVLGGMSYTDKLFTSLTTVGPVYFILLLFLTKVIYMCIELLKNEWVKNGVILLLLVLSMFLGQNGYWLPWSLDCAMFSLVFYHSAYYMKKYDILEKCRSMPFIYFALSCVWGFMIYQGPMELSVRRYGNVGLTILGIVSAFIVVYLMCSYLFEHLPRQITGVIGLIGQSTAQILVLHTLFSSRIIEFVNDRLHMDRQNIFCLAVSIIIQAVAGVLIFILNREIKKFIKSRRAAAKSEK